MMCLSNVRTNELGGGDQPGADLHPRLPGLQHRSAFVAQQRPMLRDLAVDA
jgi:hypothetical protein